MPNRKKVSTLVDGLQRAVVAEAAGIAEDPRFIALASDLLNPSNCDVEISALARKHKLSTTRFIEMWKDHHHAEALILISGRIREMYEHIVEDSMSKRDVCPRCDGDGKYKKRNCPRCGATGEIGIPGDRFSRQMLIENILGLAKRPAPAVVMQQNFGGGIGIEDMSTKLGQILDAKVENDANDGSEVVPE